MEQTLGVLYLQPCVGGIVARAKITSGQRATLQLSGSVSRSEHRIIGQGRHFD